MFNLIIKDIVIQKKTFLYALIFTIVASMGFFYMNPGPNSVSLYVFSPIAINYMFIYFALSYDDKNKSEIVLNSLPLKRNDVVIAKYISIFVFVAIGLIYSIVIGFIGKAIGLPMFTTSISLSNVVAVISIACIFNSMIFPIYFKFGAMKTQIFTVILLFIPLLAFNNPNNFKELKIIRFINNSSSLTLISLALVTSLIFFIISLIISIHIYSKKEL